MKLRILRYLLAGAFLFFVPGHPSESAAGVNVNVGIGVSLPPLVFHTPPPVFVIPGTYVYYAPDAEVDVFFYHGYWYRPHRGYWYRASGYNGPWGRIAVSRVPRVLIDVPPDFRHVPPGHQRIPYGQLKKDWRRWEREHYWDRPERREHFREERREPRGRRDRD